MRGPGEIPRFGDLVGLPHKCARSSTTSLRAVSRGVILEAIAGHRGEGHQAVIGTATTGTGSEVIAERKAISTGYDRCERWTPLARAHWFDHRRRGSRTLCRTGATRPFGERVTKHLGSIRATATSSGIRVRFETVISTLTSACRERMLDQEWIVADKRQLALYKRFRGVQHWRNRLWLLAITSRENPISFLDALWNDLNRCLGLQPSPFFVSLPGIFPTDLRLFEDRGRNLFDERRIIVEWFGGDSRRDLTRGLARAEAQKVHAKRLMELGSRPRSLNCRLQAASGSRNRSMLIPRGSRPSTAALTSWGARKASESVMFT
jgi:hypothetical protein